MNHYQPSVHARHIFPSAATSFRMHSRHKARRQQTDRQRCRGVIHLFLLRVRKHCIFSLFVSTSQTFHQR